MRKLSSTPAVTDNPILKVSDVCTSRYNSGTRASKKVQPFKRKGKPHLSQRYALRSRDSATFPKLYFQTTSHKHSHRMRSPHCKTNCQSLRNKVPFLQDPITLDNDLKSPGGVLYGNLSSQLPPKFPASPYPCYSNLNSGKDLTLSADDLNPPCSEDDLTSMESFSAYSAQVHKHFWTPSVGTCVSLLNDLIDPKHKAVKYVSAVNSFQHDWWREALVK